MTKRNEGIKVLTLVFTDLADLTALKTARRLLSAYRAG